MRLTRLRLDHYGSFASADIPLAAEPGQVTLIVAPNGAGKSVLRQAFHDVLFDIPMQSPMRFRYGYPGMALLADAIDADGAPFSFGWTRTGKPQRTHTDPARFAALIRSTTPRQLEQLFALDTARLRKGGTDLKGNDMLGVAMLAGTGELASAFKVRAALEARRTEQYGSGKSKPPLNAALAALTLARKAASDAVQAPGQREQQIKALADAQQAHATARSAQEEAVAVTRQLHRIDLVRPHLAALMEATAWFAAHPDAPTLTPGLETELADARAAAVTSAAGHRDAQQTVQDAEQRYQNITLDDAAQKHAAALTGLMERLGEVKKEQNDLPGLRDNRAKTLALIGATLVDIGASVPPEDAGTLIPAIAIVTAARGAITRHAGLVSTRDSTAKRVREAEQKRAGLEQAPPPGLVAAPDGLAPLRQEIDRNPAEHAAECAASVRDARAALAAALASVPGWTGAAGALRALAPADDAVFERLDQARHDAATTVKLARTECATTLQTSQKIRQELAALQSQPLPDAAAIRAARDIRDRGWGLIARRLEGHPDAEAERDYAGADPLALVFDRHLRHADSLADRRLEELARVTKAERLTKDLAEQDARHTGQTQAAEAAETVARTANEAWARAVAPLHLPPDATLAELGRWLKTRSKVVEALLAEERAAGEAAAVTLRHAGWAARFAQLLAIPDAPLPELLALADERVKAATKSAQVQAKWTDALANARTEQAAATLDRTHAEDALAQWETEWAHTLTSLSRPAAERPAETATVLEALSQLREYVREANGFTQRIEAMEASLARFTTDVAALAQAMDVPGGAPIETAEALIGRRDRAAGRVSAAEQESLAVTGAKATLALKDSAARAAAERLRTVVAKAGAADPVEAERRIIAAREHARHSKIRDDALAGVRQHGSGLTLEALTAASGAIPDLGSARDQAEDAAKQANLAAEATAIAVNTLQNAATKDAAATDSTATAQAQEGALSHYARLLEHQLMLHLAGGLLHRATQEVEDTMGGGALRRVSDMFGAVTGGAYHLVLDDETGAALHAVEHAFPKEKKALAELSEGTRDQLYLALRMVALQDHAAVQAPLPFIADDVLQTFDDTRARAALQALVALSGDVQVIVLTHHEHLVDLARSLPVTVIHL